MEKSNISQLIEMLKSKSVDDRAKAALELSEIKEIHDQQVVEPLIDALNDADSRVRAGVALALGNTGDYRIVEPLIETMTDEDVHVAMSAALSISEINNPNSVELLINALREACKDTVNVLLDSVAESLSEIDDRFTPRGESHKTKGPFIGGLCAYALGCFGEIALKQLISTLEDKNTNTFMALNIAKALATIGEPAIESLINFVRNEDKTYEPKGSHAIWALIKIGKPAVEPLIALLYVEDSIVREKAAYALVNITKKDFWIGKTNPKKWEKWWEQNKEAFSYKKFDLMDCLGLEK